MAVIRNITGDVLSLFHADGVAVRPNKEVDVPDANFVGRAWPKSTWALVRKPAKDHKDASVDDAHIFLPAGADEVADTAPITTTDSEESST